MAAIDKQQSPLVAKAKEIYLTRETPSAFRAPDLIAVSDKGDIVFAVKIETKISIETDGALRISVQILSRHISKYHLYSGENATYEIDDEFDILALKKIYECYSLGDNTIVLMSFDAEMCCICQHVLRLDSHRPSPDTVTRTASLVATRSLTLSQIISQPNVVIGDLEYGRILLTGRRDDQSMTVMAYLLAANPFFTNAIPDRDLSEMVTNFSTFLRTSQPDYTVFANAIFMVGDVLFVMLKTRENEELVTRMMGKIDISTGIFSMLNIDDSCIAYAGFINASDCKQAIGRGSSIWLSLVTQDVARLQTLNWMIRIRLTYIFLRMMLFTLNFCVKIRRIDDGWCLRAYMWLLEKLFGPSMMPALLPEKQFSMYWLDIKTLKYFATDYQPRKKEMPELQRICYETCFDCDASGAAVVVDLPDYDNKSELCFKYFPNPRQTQSLSRLALYKAYRSYPSFEKSSLLRRLTGVCDWNWTV